MGRAIKIFFDAENVRFTELKGEVGKIQDKFVEAGGWQCQIRADNSIKCTAKSQKGGRQYEMNLNITRDGSLRITKFIDGIKYETSRYRMRKWPVSGTIILSTGEIEERRAFFQKT